MKTLSYSYVKDTSRVPFVLPTVEKIERENFECVLSSSFPSHITQEVYGIYEQSPHQMTAPLSDIFLFLVRAACELRTTSYAPNMHCSSFHIHHFVCNYMHNLKTEGRIGMFYLPNNCSAIRDIYSLG